jgi:hypothetical protein
MIIFSIFIIIFYYSEYNKTILDLMKIADLIIYKQKYINLKNKLYIFL